MSLFADADLDRAHDRLTQVLLRAPNSQVGLRAPIRPHPRHLLWARAIEMLPEVEAWEERSPVVGTATTVRDGEPTLVVLLAHEYELDLDRLQSRLTGPYPVEALVTGPVLPAARPATGGDSISGDGFGGDTGTLGCLVESDAGDLFVLGCNHTLAGVNQAAVNVDTVRQPGDADGGRTPGDTLGTLASYHTIMLGGYHQNTIDAAVAEPASPTDVTAGAGGIAIQGVGPGLTYRDRVQKVGWKTGHTFGTYEYKISYLVDFAGGNTALFVDQYGIVGDDATTGFAQRGDSGAVVLTEDGDELVAMIIGVTQDHSIALASPIEPVLTAFGVEPVR